MDPSRELMGDQESKCYDCWVIWAVVWSTQFQLIQ